MRGSRFRSGLAWGFFVLLGGAAAVTGPAVAGDAAGSDAVVTFVCEHGAAKSVLAAALFNQLALERGVRAHAVSRGIAPSTTLQHETVAGLGRDGIRVAQAAPQPVTREDARASSRVVTIDIADEPAFLRTTKLREWDQVPAVSQGYAAARDDLRRRAANLLDELETRP
jgi:arsenate reductase